MRKPIPRILALTVLHHPQFTAGVTLAERLRKRFTGDASVAIGERLGLPLTVLRRPGLPIDLEAAETAAVVVLADEMLAKDAAWIATVETVVEACETAGLRARTFVVCIDAAALTMSPKIGAINFLRWDKWKGKDEDKAQRLVCDLTYQCCRILRSWLSQQAEHNAACRDAFAEYLANVQIFLSHSKHDGDQTGEAIAKAVRAYLHAGSGYDSFFDVHDIPPGLPFDKVLRTHVHRSAFLAVHTDSYSSRDWCGTEVIEAKRADVPMVVADAVTDREDRALPYLGNVPVVRLMPRQPKQRIPLVVDRLVLEVLKDYLWRCRRVAAGAGKDPDLGFVSRAPELISLAATGRRSGTILYPDPPLAAEEAKLLGQVAPEVKLLSFTQWLSGTKENAMPADRFLAGRTIALSVSDSPDLIELGLTPDHQRDALGELTRHLLAAGATLVYGGDLRANGFTELLFQLAARHAIDPREPVVINPLPWPVHCTMYWSELEAKAQAAAPVARIELLARDGSIMPPALRAILPGHTPNKDEWKIGLTTMRRTVAARVDAYVLLGGQVEMAKIKGRMPGIAEEALEAIKARRPVYLAGGFGGCARDVIEVLGVAPAHPLSHAAEWGAAALFSHRSSKDLNAGLDAKELERLAVTANVDEIAALVLRGLQQLGVPAN